MSDKMDYLKYRLCQLQNAPKNSVDFNWLIPKEILCLLSDLIKDVAKHLPDHLKWLHDLLHLISNILHTHCQLLAGIEFKNLQYAHTRG